MGHIKDVTTHLGEPLEAVLAVARVDGVDSETLPDLTRLRLAQPQLAVLQQEPDENQQVHTSTSNIEKIETITNITTFRHQRNIARRISRTGRDTVDGTCKLQDTTRTRTGRTVSVVG